MLRGAAVMLTLWSVLPQVRAQQVVSLHAGLLNYVEGIVATTSPVPPRAGIFHLKQGEELQTGRGRAELMLTPAVFLRLGEDARVRMINNSISEPEVEILSGSAVLDAVEVVNGSRVRIRLGSAEAEVQRQGIFRFDAGDRDVQVHEGKLSVNAQGVTFSVPKGKRWSEATNKVGDFDRKMIDWLRQWSARRALAIARENLKVAQMAYGDNWRRVSRMWQWSIYINSETALAHPRTVASSGY